MRFSLGVGLLLCAALVGARAQAAESPLDSSSMWPVEIDLAKVLDVVVGQSIGCAATRSGEMACWSLRRPVPETTGPLPSRPTSAPEPITVGEDSGVLRLALTQDRLLCAWKKDGQAVCWAKEAEGWSKRGEPLPHVINIGGGGAGVCAVLENGVVTCQTLAGEAWVPVKGLTQRARAVAVGDTHGCIVTQTDTVECWGKNRFRQLGVADPKAKVATVPQVSRVVAVSVAPTHSCALQQNGNVLCWGGIFWRSEDSGVSVRRIPFARAVRDMSTSSAVTCAVDGEGKLLHRYGPFHELAGRRQLGQASRVVASPYQICVLRQDETLSCFADMRWDWATVTRTPSSPSGPASVSVRLAVGGGKRMRPELEQERLFEMALRADVLFGEFSKQQSSWGVGPLVDIRSVDFDTFEAGAGVLGYIKTGRMLSFLLAVGCGWAGRGPDQSGAVGFATFSLGHRSPLSSSGSGGRVIYSPNFNLYVDSRVGWSGPRVVEVTAGLEFEPVLILALPLGLLGLLD